MHRDLKKKKKHAADVCLQSDFVLSAKGIWVEETFNNLENKLLTHQKKLSHKVTIYLQIDYYSRLIYFPDLKSQKVLVEGTSTFLIPASNMHTQAHAHFENRL